MKYRNPLSCKKKKELKTAGNLMKRKLLHTYTHLDLTYLMNDLNVSNEQTSILVSQKHKNEVKRNLFHH